MIHGLRLIARRSCFQKDCLISLIWNSPGLDLEKTGRVFSKSKPGESRSRFGRINLYRAIKLPIYWTVPVDLAVSPVLFEFPPYIYISDSVGTGGQWKSSQ